MSTDNKSPSFWTTLPGIVTAIAGLITAVSGLLVVLNQTGVIGGEDRPVGAPAVGTTSSQSPSIAGVVGGEGDALGGTWRGTVRPRDGGSPFNIRLEIATPCRLKEPCGTIAVSSAPCAGRATLWGVRSGTYEFYIDRFTKASSPDCTPGPGDFFRLREDGTLKYTTDYSDAVGDLHKVR